MDFVLILLSGALGAVLGALIPVALQPYLGHRTKLYEQKVRHANRLNRLELELQDIDSGLYDNVFAIKNILDAVKRGKITTLRPKVFIVDDATFNDILSEDLNNELFSLRYDLKRLQGDIDSFNFAYDTINTSLLSGSMKKEDYTQHVAGLVGALPLLIKHMERIRKHTLRVLAIVRARRKKDKTWLMRHRSKIQQKWLQKVSEEEIKQNLERHEKDVEENRRKQTPDKG